MNPTISFISTKEFKQVQALKNLNIDFDKVYKQIQYHRQAVAFEWATVDQLEEVTPTIIETIEGYYPEKTNAKLEYFTVDRTLFVRQAHWTANGNEVALAASKKAKKSKKTNY